MAVGGGGWGVGGGGCTTFALLQDKGKDRSVEGTAGGKLRISYCCLLKGLVIVHVSTTVF